jgi:hypothetical protein
VRCALRRSTVPEDYRSPGGGPGCALGVFTLAERSHTPGGQVAAGHGGAEAASGRGGRHRSLDLGERQPRRTALGGQPGVRAGTGKETRWSGHAPILSTSP